MKSENDDWLILIFLLVRKIPFIEIDIMIYIENERIRKWLIGNPHNHITLGVHDEK